MKTGLISILSSILAFSLSYAVATAGQSPQEFVDKAGNYKITLTGEWRPVNYTDAAGRKKTEYVYGERREGLLRISRESLAGISLADISSKELEGLKLCQSGVTVGKDEPFEEGILKGRRLAFCYIEGSRWVAAIYYFLEDRNVVWILRFTGRMGLFDTNPDLTDSVARSFFPLIGTNKVPVL